MELAAAGLKEQPFGPHGKPLVFVPYAAQEAAFDFLSTICAERRGLGLFQGPPMSGKTTLLQQFSALRPDDSAVAIVEGAGLNTTTFLEAVLSQFGYDLHFDSVNELINMVKVFAMQQAASDHVPLLIIEDTHALNPSALRVLCELAELKVRTESALRIVLASDRPISSIIDAPAMEPIAKRLTGDLHLEPMTKDETTDYLHAKLRAGGCAKPQAVLPQDTCDELHAASGGWPGVLDRLVYQAIAKAEQCPIGKDDVDRQPVPESTLSLVVENVDRVRPAAYSGTKPLGPPKLYLTYNGRTLREIDVDRPRLLIGRSDHNDICVNSRFISRHHALFIKMGAVTVLMDLNSTNGTYVNSQRVTKHVLIHDDVVSVGNHRIKFHDPRARERGKLEGAGFAETVVMKSLGDVRKLRAKEETQLLPVQAGDSPPSGDSK